MLTRCLKLTLLAAALVAPLAGCIIEPYRHHHDYYGDRGPVYAPAPPPGYYRGY